MKKSILGTNSSRKMLIQAGSENPTKLKGTKKALQKVFGSKFILKGGKENSGVSAHPFNKETFKGAKTRAKNAWKKAKCDYSLGIESGLFFLNKLYIDITVCCVYDGKECTYGTGMGFVLPEKIARKIREKDSDLTKAIEEMTGIKKIGRKQGALGWFSAGMMHRSEQIEAAVACAFIPRIAKEKLEVKY